MCQQAYTVPEAAATLHLSERTIWRLIATSQLDSVKIGHARLIPGVAIRELLHTSAVKP